MEIKVKNSTVIIDKEDLPILESRKWHINDGGYLVWRGINGDKKMTIRFHRVVMNAPKGKVIDHINGNKLDNRKSNLRICTQKDNSRNRAGHRQKTYNGYWQSKTSRKWIVEVYGIYRGSFEKQDDAKKFAEDVYSGKEDFKYYEKKTHCKHGHDLNDAYIYSGHRRCRKCQSNRSKKYFRRTYIPNPKQVKEYCRRGHFRKDNITKNGDCRICIRIRTNKWRINNAKKDNN